MTHAADELLETLEDSQDERPVGAVLDAIDADPSGFFRAVESRRLHAPERAVESQQPISWKNWAGNIEVSPDVLFDLTQLNAHQLQQLVIDSAQAKKRLHVVGSGHSWSEILSGGPNFVAGTSDTRPRKYNGDMPLVRAVDSQLLKSGVDAQGLVDLACCARLSELNAALSERSKAFINLGGATVQTLGGAVLTGTHGSGYKLGMIGDSVKSILVISCGGQLLQIEPKDGITERTAFESAFAGERTLVQDDVAFYSLLVSFGCMAIAVRMTVEVLPSYLLKETRRLTKWSELREELRAGKHLGARHCEVLVNPHATVGNSDHNCLLTLRDFAAPGEKPSPAPKIRAFEDWLATCHPVQDVIVWFLNRYPKIVPGFIDLSLKHMNHERPYVDRSYNIYDIKRLNDFKAISSEIGYAMSESVFVDAMDSLLSVSSANRKRHMTHVGPMAMRFVAPSKAYLSMFYGAPDSSSEISRLYAQGTCMVEFPQPVGTNFLYEMLESYEQDSIRFTARPHWGQWHRIVLEEGWAKSNYEKFDDWVSAFRALNWNALLDTPFSDAMRFRHSSDALGVTLSSDLSDELRTLAEAVLGLDTIIPSTAIASRAVELIASMGDASTFAEDLRDALKFVQWGLPLLGPYRPPFSKLSFEHRRTLIAKCFSPMHRGLLRDIARAVKLITVFPYYTDDTVKQHIGYEPPELRDRFIKGGAAYVAPKSYPRPR